MTETAPLLYRIGDAVTMLSVSRPTIYRMIARGELRTVHVGTAPRITAESLWAIIVPAKEAENAEGLSA